MAYKERSSSMNAFIVLIALCLFILGAQAEDNPAIEMLQEYLDFAEYSEGSISTDQLSSIDSEKILFVDTRNKAQYKEGHIPGAINIEWRQILSRRNELPTDRTIVLYCETGLLSSKAHLALRMAGRENVKVLWGGYLMWSARQSFEEAEKENNMRNNALQPTAKSGGKARH